MGEEGGLLEPGTLSGLGKPLKASGCVFLTEVGSLDPLSGSDVESFKQGARALRGVQGVMGEVGCWRATDGLESPRSQGAGGTWQPHPGLDMSLCLCLRPGSLWLVGSHPPQLSPASFSLGIRALRPRWDSQMLGFGRMGNQAP